MSQSYPISEPVLRYLGDTLSPEPAVMRELRERTHIMPGAHMLVAPEQARFLRFMVKLLNAKQVIEVGTYTGYSAMAMALELPKGGKLIALDRDPSSAEIAREFWEKANVADKIELMLGEAKASLAKLTADKKNHSRFDFAFIDANKKAYADYYEACLQLVRKGGVIALDNIFMSGEIVENTGKGKAMAKLSQHLLNDKRVFVTTLPIADGLTLAIKE